MGGCWNLHWNQECQRGKDSQRRNPPLTPGRQNLNPSRLKYVQVLLSLDVVLIKWVLMCESEYCFWKSSVELGCEASPGGELMCEICEIIYVWNYMCELYNYIIIIIIYIIYIIIIIMCELYVWNHMYESERKWIYCFWKSSVELSCEAAPGGETTHSNCARIHRESSWEGEVRNILFCF